MAKLGVGIGEDFPMDDSARVDDERRRREWARRKQAFRDFWRKVKIAARESFGEDWDYYTARFRARWWPYGVLILVCAAFAAIALASAIVAAAPALLVSICGFAFVFWIYRKKFGTADDTGRPETVIVTPPVQQ
jgi:hypothetical protein